MLTEKELAEKCGLYLPESRQMSDGTTKITMRCGVDWKERNVFNRAGKCGTPDCPFWKPVGSTDKIRRETRYGKVYFATMPEELKSRQMTAKEYSNWFYGRGGAER